MTTHTWPPCDPLFSSLVLQERQLVTAKQYDQGLVVYHTNLDGSACLRYTAAKTGGTHG
jgi:hypothetical protein